jgi:hypothetical protein
MHRHETQKLEVTSLDYITLNLLTWRIWWAPNNANRWQMGFNLAFKVLIPFAVSCNNLTNMNCRLMKRNFLTYVASYDLINRVVQSLILHLLTFSCNHIRYSVRQLATRWTVRDRTPVGTRLSAPFQTGLGAHPASYTMGTGSFPWVNWPGRDVDHPLPSRTEVKGRVQL